MWFKNLYMFQLQEPWDITAEKLDGQLEHNIFQKCPASVKSTVGWVSPLGRKSNMLSYHVNGYVMICLRGEEKQVPSSLLQEELANKIELIEQAETRDVSKRERQLLKDDIYEDLLARALVKSWQMHAYVDIKSGYLIVNTASSKKAELLTVMLRKALGSLKVSLPSVDKNFSQVDLVLTNWLNTNKYPDDLVIGQRCVLQSKEDKTALIRCQNQDLFRKEIQQMVNNDTTVTSLMLTWQEKISFTLSQEYVFKSLKYHEVIQEQLKDIHTETDLEKFDADFSVMSLLLSEFLSRMKAMFSKQHKQALDAGANEASVDIKVDDLVDAE